MPNLSAKISDKELLDEAIGLLCEIFDEGSVGGEDDRNEYGELYHSAARMLVFMYKIGVEVDPTDLKEAKDKMGGE